MLIYKSQKRETIRLKEESKMKKSFCIKIIVLFCLTGILTLSGYAKKEIINSIKLTSPLNIDGTMDDWKEDTLYFEKKAAADIGFKNDGETLFILFHFKDPKHLSTIQSTGMTIWFDTEGKEKKNYGITFLKKIIAAKDYLSLLEKQRGPLSEEDKNKVLANPSYIFHETNVTNKKDKSSSDETGSEQTKPAIFRSESTKEMAVYEFAIPLKRVSRSAPGIDTEPGKVIKVGFEWGGMTDAMRKSKLQRQSQSQNRFGEKRGLSTRSRRPPKKYSFWVEVQLAQI
jgi:hypothetical protein